MGNVGIVQLGLWLCGPQPMPAAAGKLWGGGAAEQLWAIAER